MKKNEKVTLEQLIKKKLFKDDKKTATKEIYIESLGGNITFRNPSDAMHIEYSERVRSGEYGDLIDGLSKIIYDCCPMLQSKELQESIGVAYPYDTVKAIFDIDEIVDIGLSVVNFFKEDEDKEDEKTEDSLKN